MQVGLTHTIINRLKTARSKKPRKCTLCVPSLVLWAAVAVPYGAVSSNCSCCAERRLLAQLQQQAKREGIKPARFSCWTYRKFGHLVIQRTRKDGLPGISLPCVICRKALDRLRIPWMCHVDEKWYRSTDPDVPDSKPTNKQRNMLHFQNSLKRWPTLVIENAFTRNQV
jgi:hypothetical protein